MIVCVLESCENAPERQVYFVDTTKLQDANVRHSLEHHEDIQVFQPRPGQEDFQDIVQKAIVSLPLLVERQVDVWI